MRKYLRNTALRILLCSNGLILLAGAMLAPIYAIFVERIGGDILDAGFAGAVFALAAGVTVLLSGKWSDRVPEPKTIVAVGYGIMGTGFFFMTCVDTIWGLLLTQVITGLGEALYVPAYDKLYSEHLDGNSEGTEWGVWEAMNYFATAIGAAAGGALVHFFGFYPLFILMSLLCFVSGLYLYRLPKKTL